MSQAVLLSLVYHHVHPTQDNYLTITPTVFEQQLQVLRDRGYVAVTTADVAAFVEEGRPLPAKPVLVTLDDGWRNQIDYAVPVLEQAGMVATFFPYRSVVGGSGFMSETDLRNLAEKGFDIQSHTLGHSSVLGVSSSRADRGYAETVNELRASREWIESLTATRCVALAYPYGYYDADARAIVQDAGFTVAFTVDDGKTAIASVDPFAIQRFTVFRDDSIEDFIDKVDSVVLESVTFGMGDVIDGEITLTAETPAQLVDRDSIELLVDVETVPIRLATEGERLRVFATARLEPGFHYVTLKGRLRSGRWVFASWGAVVD